MEQDISLGVGVMYFPTMDFPETNFDLPNNMALETY
jgi:hypothetical protein